MWTCPCCRRAGPAGSCTARPARSSYSGAPRLRLGRRSDSRPPCRRSSDGGVWSGSETGRVGAGTVSVLNTYGSFSAVCHICHGMRATRSADLQVFGLLSPLHTGSWSSWQLQRSLPLSSPFPTPIPDPGAVGSSSGHCRSPPLSPPPYRILEQLAAPAVTAALLPFLHAIPDPGAVGSSSGHCHSPPLSPRHTGSWSSWQLQRSWHSPPLSPPPYRILEQLAAPAVTATLFPFPHPHTGSWSRWQLQRSLPLSSPFPTHIPDPGAVGSSSGHCHSPPLSPPPYRILEQLAAPAVTATLLPFLHAIPDPGAVGSSCGHCHSPPLSPPPYRILEQLAAPAIMALSSPFPTPIPDPGAVGSSSGHCHSPLFSPPHTGSWSSWQLQRSLPLSSPFPTPIPDPGAVGSSCGHCHSPPLSPPPYRILEQLAAPAVTAALLPFPHPHTGSWSSWQLLRSLPLSSPFPTPIPDPGAVGSSSGHCRSPPLSPAPYRILEQLAAPAVTATLLPFPHPHTGSWSSWQLQRSLPLSSPSSTPYRILEQLAAPAVTVTLLPFLHAIPDPGAVGSSSGHCHSPPLSPPPYRILEQLAAPAVTAALLSFPHPHTGSWSSWQLQRSLPLSSPFPTPIPDPGAVGSSSGHCRSPPLSPPPYRILEQLAAPAVTAALLAAAPALGRHLQTAVAVLYTVVIAETLAHEKPAKGRDLVGQ